MRWIVVANIIGQFWRALILLAFVPFYIRLLGIEAYGLIGMLATLQVWLTLLDLGLRPALVREMARYVGGGRDGRSTWLLLRSVEIIALLLAAVVFTVMMIASNWLANHWVHPQTLDPPTIAIAFIMMGFVAATQLIESVYNSAMVGLQRQITQNVISTVAVTARAVGALLILSYVSRSITAFFLWQGVISLLSAIVSGVVVYRALPKREERPKFSKAVIFDIRHYAMGMVGISVLSLILTQLDKVLLANRLPLQSYGYYVLAGSVAGALSMMSTPIGSAYFPRMTELVERNDRILLATSFHQAAQLMAVLVGAAGMSIAICAERLLSYWTRDPVVVAQTAPLLAVMAIGTCFNALSSILYALQTAHGWTTLTIRINLVAAALLIPGLLFATSHYGGVGAAWAWLAINAGGFVASVIGTFRKVLPGERGRFIVRDLAVPLMAIGIAVGSAAALVPTFQSPIAGLASLGLVGACGLAAGCLAAPQTRSFVATALIRLSKSTTAIRGGRSI